LQYPDNYLQILGMHQAISEEAQIRETMRNRSIGPEAPAYNQVNPREIYTAYYNVHLTMDPQGQSVLVAETNQHIAEAVLADLQRIIADRAV
jgi:hypothetical protein